MLKIFVYVTACNIESYKNLKIIFTK